jgi:hypothetical protein
MHLMLVLLFFHLAYPPASCGTYVQANDGYRWPTSRVSLGHLRRGITGPLIFHFLWTRLGGA